LGGIFELALKIRRLSAAELILDGVIVVFVVMNISFCLTYF
jgi:hypothetical protein